MKRYKFVAGDVGARDNNAGDFNAGHKNAGAHNAGDNNAGDNNAGHNNASDNNAGAYHAGDNNAGDFDFDNDSEEVCSDRDSCAEPLDRFESETSCQPLLSCTRYEIIEFLTERYQVHSCAGQEDPAIVLSLLADINLKLESEAATADGALTSPLISANLAESARRKLNNATARIMKIMQDEELHCLLEIFALALLKAVMARLGDPCAYPAVDTFLISLHVESFCAAVPTFSFASRSAPVADSSQIDFFCIRKLGGPKSALSCR